MTKLKLEVGKYYRTRDGRKVGPMEPYDDDSWHCGDGDFGLWCEDGSPYYSFKEESDSPRLIAEWIETPAIGTLAEIGAQVGDVVEVTQWIGFKFIKGDTGVVVSGSHHSNGRFGIDSGAGQFRIISRAPDAKSPIDLAMQQGWGNTPVSTGPVITETVKRIVPGVYGKVIVGNWNGGADFVPVQITTEWTLLNGDKDIGHAIMSRADLIAARDVFNAMIDAMEG